MVDSVSNVLLWLLVLLLYSILYRWLQEYETLLSSLPRRVRGENIHILTLTQFCILHLINIIHNCILIFQRVGIFKDTATNSFTYLKKVFNLYVAAVCMCVCNFIHS
jgi:hypothetical protein